MLIEDIMSRDPLYVEENDFLTKARQMVRDNHVRGLPVLDAQGLVLGILTNRDILRITSSRSNVTVAGFTVQVPLITGDMDTMETARMMMNERAEILPVVQSQETPKLRGVVSIIDIFGSIDLDSLPRRAVSAIMSTSVVTCQTDDHVSKVWETMMESDLTGLPVLDQKGRPLWMITRFDILGGPRISKEGASRPSDAMHMKAEKLMSTPLFHVGPNDDMADVIKIMLKQQVGRVTVLEDDKLVGIVDRYDLIRSYLDEGT